MSVLEEGEVIELPEQLSRFKKFLKSYVWDAGEGKIVLLPILHRYGESIEWSARIHKKGVVGAIKYTDENAGLINASSTLKGEVKMTKEILEREFSAIPSAVKVELAKEVRKTLK